MWRQGRHRDIHVYEQLGARPADQDRAVGTFLTGDDAQLAVQAVNDRAALLVLQARVTDAVHMLADLRHEHDGLDQVHAVLTGRTVTP
jgi:hypothetical protein